MVGAKQAYEKVAMAEMAVLYRVAKRLSRDASDAEDLVGQALLAGAKAWENFDGRYARSWLIKILTNEYLAMKRKRSVRPETVTLADTFDPPTDGLAQEVENRALTGELLKELDALPEEYRLAVALCDVEEMAYQEAADALGVPVGTVRSRLFRGRRILRDRLAGFIDGEACQVGGTA